MKNRKIMAMLVLLVFVVSIAAFSADVSAASPEGLFAKIGYWIEKGFAKLTGKEFMTRQQLPWYEKYAQFFDFIIFLVLFTSLSTIGLKKFGGKSWGESGAGNAVISLSIIMGLAMAIAAVKAGLSVTFFIPFVKNMLYFLVLMLVYFVLIKLFMDKHKFLAFLLAIAIVTFSFWMTGFGDFRYDLGSDLEGWRTGSLDGTRRSAGPTFIYWLTTPAF